MKTLFSVQEDYSSFHEGCAFTIYNISRAWGTECPFSSCVVFWNASILSQSHNYLFKIEPHKKKKSYGNEVNNVFCIMIQVHWIYKHSIVELHSFAINTPLFWKTWKVFIIWTRHCIRVTWSCKHNTWCFCKWLTVKSLIIKNLPCTIKQRCLTKDLFFPFITI